VLQGVLHGLDSLTQKGYVVTQGTFDGVHLGHQTVLKQVIAEAKRRKLPSMLITYFPHPRSVVQPQNWNPEILSSIEEKAEAVLQLGIDNVLVLPFNESIAALSPQEFIQNILIERIGMQCIIVGYDHRFGKNRAGNFDTLLSMSSKFGFEVIEIEANEIDDIAVSSTRIRKYLREGQMKEANQLLGKPYLLSGRVIHGEKRGRTIGFPTANILPDEPHKLVPKTGVYLATTHIDGINYKALVNIGFRPTFNGEKLSIEVHILEYKGNLYDRRIQVNMHDFLRNERKFESIDALLEQIKKDATHAAETSFNI